jgi:diaminohydroxyphosphoribosylaminopyrimidine deaminase/5-amino-6-(5-phosphoribosylamino)uracil reductase
LSGNITYKKIATGKDLAPAILSALYACGIVSVLVEGGSVLLSTFMASGNWDECRVFKSVKILGDGIPAPAFPSGTGSAVTEDINGDQLFTTFNFKFPSR